MAGSSEGRFLVKVALNTVCRFYHMVRRNQVSKCLEAAILAQGNAERLATSKLFALFALGELYSTKVAPPDGSFPGLIYFARARRNVTVPAERPQLDTMEITLLLACQFYQEKCCHMLILANSLCIVTTLTDANLLIFLQTQRSALVL